MPLTSVISKTAATPRGHRLWPPPNARDDQKYNFRADKGSELKDGKQEIIIQANKNAENKGVRESAQKNSHKIVSKFPVDPKNDSKGSNVEKDALASFDKNN